MKSRPRIGKFWTRPERLWSSNADRSTKGARLAEQRERFLAALLAPDPIVVAVIDGFVIEEGIPLPMARRRRSK